MYGQKYKDNRQEFENTDAQTKYFESYFIKGCNAEFGFNPATGCPDRRGEYGATGLTVKDNGCSTDENTDDTYTLTFCDGTTGRSYVPGYSVDYCCNEHYCSRGKPPHTDLRRPAASTFDCHV